MSKQLGLLQRQDDELIKLDDEVRQAADVREAAVNVAWIYDTRCKDSAFEYERKS